MRRVNTQFDWFATVVAPEFTRVSAGVSAPAAGLGAVELLVDRFHADVEALGHVPLQARTDAPGVPVVAATGAATAVVPAPAPRPSPTHSIELAEPVPVPYFSHIAL